MKSSFVLLLSLVSILIFQSCATSDSINVGKEQMRQVIKSQAKNFRLCYEKEFDKDKTLEGKVIIAWEVTEQGNTQNFKTDDRTTLKNENIKECIINILKITKFPNAPNGQVTEIIYPFVFKSEAHNKL